MTPATGLGILAALGVGTLAILFVVWVWVVLWIVLRPGANDTAEQIRDEWSSRTPPPR